MDLHAAYLQRRQAEPDEVDAEFKTLELKAGTASAAQAIELYSDLQELRTRLTDTRHTLDELRDFKSNHWEDVKDKLEAAWKELQTALERVHNEID
jgi:hypothetical protein